MNLNINFVGINKSVPDLSQTPDNPPLPVGHILVTAISTTVLPVKLAYNQFVTNFPLCLTLYIQLIGFTFSPLCSTLS